MSRSNKFIWPDNVFFEPEAEKDFAALDNSQRLVVFKAILKVSFYCISIAIITVLPSLESLLTLLLLP